LYVSGHSNGGGGTWNLLSRFPGRFAAAVPIAAVSPTAGFVPQNLVDTPIFALHARDDQVVSVGTTRSVVTSILSAAQQPSPAYPSSSSSVFFLVSNPALESHEPVSQLVHDQGFVIDYSISGRKPDLLYIETPFLGHGNVLGVFEAPELYNWMFAQSTAVPEPATIAICLTSAIAVALRRPKRKIVCA
jgi:predicted peptidase